MSAIAESLLHFDRHSESKLRKAAARTHHPHNADCSGNVHDRRSHFAACEDRSDEDRHALFIDDPVKFLGVDVISKNMDGG